MVDFSLWDIVRNLVLAARWTVLLSLVAFVGGGVLGLTLLALRVARLPGAETGTRIFVEIFQGTPLLMQLFLSYFGLALLGIQVSAWVHDARGRVATRTPLDDATSPPATSTSLTPPIHANFCGSNRTPLPS